MTDDKVIRKRFSAYMRSVADAAKRHTLEGGLYEGVDGAKRLARECGPAMLDFWSFGEQNISSTYSAICVIAYNLKPPIDAKTWNTELRAGMRKARTDVHDT